MTKKKSDISVIEEKQQNQEQFLELEKEFYSVVNTDDQEVSKHLDSIKMEELQEAANVLKETVMKINTFTSSPEPMKSKIIRKIGTILPFGKSTLENMANNVYGEHIANSTMNEVIEKLFNELENHKNKIIEKLKMLEYVQVSMFEKRTGLEEYLTKLQKYMVTEPKKNFQISSFIVTVESTILDYDNRLVENDKIAKLSQKMFAEITKKLPNMRSKLREILTSANVLNQLQYLNDTMNEVEDVLNDIQIKNSEKTDQVTIELVKSMVSSDQKRIESLKTITDKREKAHLAFQKEWNNMQQTTEKHVLTIQQIRTRQENLDMKYDGTNAITYNDDTK